MTRHLCAALLAGWLAGCATPVIDAVQERLDPETGTTVTRLASPLELLAAAPRERDLDPFAWLAPFETNRMGVRATFLWVATPGDTDATPVVRCGALTTRPASAPLTPSAIGLVRPPYRLPAAWNREYLLPIDATWVECLASGAALAVEIARDQFASDGRRRGDLAQFAARLAR